MFYYMLYLFVKSVSTQRLFLRSKTLSKREISNTFIALKKRVWTIIYRRSWIVLL